MSLRTDNPACLALNCQAGLPAHFPFYFCFLGTSFAELLVGHFAAPDSRVIRCSVYPGSPSSTPVQFQKALYLLGGFFHALPRLKKDLLVLVGTVSCSFTVSLFFRLIHLLWNFIFVQLCCMCLSKRLSFLSYLYWPFFSFSFSTSLYSGHDGFDITVVLRSHKDHFCHWMRVAFW